MLSHRSGTFGGIVGVYQQYDFQDEMREAIAKWEKRLTVLTWIMQPMLADVA